MNYDELRDDPWERPKPFLPGGSKSKRWPRSDNRRFLNALLWMGRAGEWPRAGNQAISFGTACKVAIFTPPAGFLPHTNTPKLSKMRG